MTAQVSFNQVSRKIAIAIMAIFGLFVVAGAADLTRAATGINRQINFQGKLVQGSGASAPNTNVSDNTYSIVFTFYDRASGGTALWTETQSVTTVDGIFRVSLGSVTPFPANFNFNWDGLYLGMKVGSDSEMTPRIQMAAVPFAFNAEKVSGLTVQDENGNSSTSGTLKVANAKTVMFSDAFTAATGSLTFANGAGLTIAANKSIAVNNGLTLAAGSDGVTYTFPSPQSGTAAIVLTNNAASQTINSGQTSGTQLTISNSAALSGSSTGLAINLSGTNSQAQTGLSFAVSGTGTLYDIKGTGNNWSITSAGVLNVSSCSGCGISSQWTTINTNDIYYATGNVGIGLTNPTTWLHVSDNGKTALGKAIAIFNQYENQDIFTASASGSPIFTITRAGGIQLGSSVGTGTQCLLGGATASWGACGTSTFSPWLQNNSNGTLNPVNNTLDLLVGGTATSSAKFAVLNLNPGNANTPVASISAQNGLGQAIYVDSAGSIQTTQMNSLAIGGTTTGKLSLINNGSNNLGIDIVPGNSYGQLRIGSSTQDSKASILLGTYSTASAGSDKYGLENNITLVGSINSPATGFMGIYNSPSVNLQSGTSNTLNNLYSFYSSGSKQGGTINNFYNYYAKSTGGIASNSYAFASEVGAGNVGFGTTSPISRLQLTSSGGIATGKALAIFDQYENQDIFTASASGVTKFVVGNSGNISLAAGGAVDTLAAGSLGLGNTTANAVTLSNSGATTTINGSALTVGPTSWTATPTISGLITASSGVTISANKTLTLGAGNTTNAPLIFMSGTNLSAAAAGAMEWDGTNLYITQTTGPTRKTLAYTDTFSSTAGKVDFGNIATGTNTTATMTVGTGGSLTFSGSGTINASTLGGATFAAPGAIGGTTPGTGAFTSLSANAIGTGLTLSGAGTSIAFSGAGVGQITTASGQDLALMPGGTGTVGIGTTTAASQLHVTRALANGATGKALAIFDQIENQDILTASAAGVTKFVIANNGNVGIGTTTPTAAKLVISESNAPAADMTQIINSTGTSTTGVDGLQVDFKTAGTTANVDNSGIRINVTAGGTGTSSTLEGLMISNLAGSPSGNVTETALKIGTGWDKGLDFTGAAGIYTVHLESDAGTLASGITFGTASPVSVYKSASGQLTLGDGTNNLVLDAANGPSYQNGMRPTKQIILSPEFAGAVLTASGSATTIGNMTSDASSSAALSNWRTYYNWTSSQTSLQDYTIAVRVTLPKDFSAWTASNAVQVNYNTALTTNNTNKFDLFIYNSDTSLTSAQQATPVAYKQANVSASQKTWTSLSLPATDLTGGSVTWNTAGGTAVFYIKVYAKDNNYVQIGDIVLNYLAKF